MGRFALRAPAALVLGVAALPALAQSAPWTCDQRTPGRHVLQFRSGIDPGEAKRFTDAWKACFGAGYAGTYTLDLHSGGGVVTEALAIANVLVDTFKDKPPLLMTRIPAGARCVSACTYLFVAGQRRQVESGGSLEPHGFSSFLGDRVDSAVGQVVAHMRAQNVSLCKAFLAVDERAWIGRLQFAGNALRQVLADRRLGWALEFAELPLKTCEDVERKVDMYLKLSPERQQLLAHIDSVTAITMPEVERSAALRAFRTHFAMKAGVVSNEAVPLLDRPEGHLRWALGSYLDGINAYLEKSGQPPKLKDLEAAAAGLRAAQQERIGSASDSANGRLGVYLDRRADDIDVPAFVKLMFSTSILYTRPLTREELCDHNLVNVGCSP